MGKGFFKKVAEVGTNPDTEPYKKEIIKSISSVAVLFPTNMALDKMFSTVVKKIPEKTAITKSVYFPEQDNMFFDTKQINEKIKIVKNLPELKKFLKNKKGVNLKKKKVKKDALRDYTNIYADEKKEKTVCLDKCEQKIKTSSGCYCQSECGKSILTGKDWCYVDKEKCKRGKILEKGVTGKAYDYCSPKDISSREVCFNGSKYENCVSYMSGANRS